MMVPRQQPETDDRLCERCFLEPLAAECSACAGLSAGFAEALARALDLREHETGLHSRRVACHTVVLAKRFIPNDERRLAQIYWGALLHDVGKIGVPDRILLKNGPLDDDEWAMMRRHPEDGHHLVNCLPGMQEAAEMVRCHEERFDGKGYPRGLRGDAIPLGARIFAVIDTLDAMTSDRPYRKGLSFDAAKAEILRMSGKQFDPLAVDAFVAEEAVLRRMVQMKCERDVGESWHRHA
jgi:HD-GYP domain-containing protein (c-di-GMP phosphodiesterase class II)